jgi:hypothetical protein
MARPPENPENPEKKKSKPKKRSSKSTVRTKQDKIKLSNKVFETYNSGNYTLESCCNENGISVRTLSKWCEVHSEIAEAKKRSKEINSKANKEGVRDVALHGLRRLITGFHVEEEEIEEFKDKTGQLISTRTKKKRRFVSPATAAIIFALKNVDSANWNDGTIQDSQTEEQIFKIGTQIIKF